MLYVLCLQGWTGDRWRPMAVARRLAFPRPGRLVLRGTGLTARCACNAARKRTLRCRKIRSPRERRLECVDGLLVASQTEQYQSKVVPDAGQRRTVTARCPQALGGSVQSAIDVDASSAVVVARRHGLEGLDRFVAAPGAVPSQAEKLQ